MQISKSFFGEKVAHLSTKKLSHLKKNKQKNLMYYKIQTTGKTIFLSSIFLLNILKSIALFYSSHSNGLEEA